MNERSPKAVPPARVEKPTELDRATPRDGSGAASSAKGNQLEPSARASRSKRPDKSRRSRRSARPRKGFGPAQLAARAAALPVITYPDLPVSARRDDIAAAIRDHQVVVVAGETGSGKTTQIPKICLELGRGISAMIGHTQPRRLAARAVAERIAEELGQKVSKQVGDVVGYQVRFTDEVGPTTLVKLMTDGILLAEMGLDPLLKRYDTIIVDEAHERSLNIDFILGYLARILPKRPDLKVIITSATIDSQRFAKHFEGQVEGDVPVIEVSGRAFPVEVRYRPLSADLEAPEEDDATEEDGLTVGTQLHEEASPGDYAALGYGLGKDLDIESALTAAVDELLTEERGDILVFLPGERDIVEASQALKDHLKERYVADERDPHRPDGVEVVPLFARLSAAEQHRIYAPHSLQRVVLATNIAETSLTVPGIRYVIDAGLARISRFSNKTKVQRLPIEPVSQASAAQRAGRAGRTSPGIAIRLYSQRDYRRRPAYTEPEILRTSLAAVILQMASLGLGEVRDFPFLDAPNPRAVRDGVQLLTEIGALDDGKITTMGRRLAQLPIDPRLGRMLIEADRQGCASEVLVIVAALSIQDPRERPAELQEAADQAHRRYADPTSDFITYLNMWRYLGVQSRDLSGSAFRRLCKREFFHYLRFREWRDIVGQLRQMCRQIGIRVDTLGLPSRTFVDAQNDVPAAVLAYGEGSQSVDADQIHRALLSGLLSNIGSWDEVKHEYVGARGSRFTVWPGSALRRRRPEWVMAAELVETSRLFARTVAGIKPEWIENYAGPLAKHTYSEPIWSRARGAAQVSERVTLYGLTLVAGRLVPLSRLGDTVLGRDWSGSAAQSLEEISSSGVVRGEIESVTGDLTARDLAREMFVSHALVDGDWRENHWAFVAHNRAVMEEAKSLSNRMRDPSLVPDEGARYRFFDSRIPGHVTNAASFGKWWKDEKKSAPHLLDYALEDLLPSGAPLDPTQFPAVWSAGDFKLDIQYAFAPGSQEDGISVTIPLALLPRVKDEGFDWLVPGLLEDLCIAMIRGLPKQKRRFLTPATQTGKEIVGELAVLRDGSTASDGDESAPPTASPERADGDGSSGADEPNPYSLEASLVRLRAWGDRTGNVTASEGQQTADEGAGSREPVVTGAAESTKRGRREAPPHFDTAFARVIRDRSGVELSAEDLRAARAKLPAHLRISFRAVDERGAIVGAAESLTALQQRFARRAAGALQSSIRDALTQAREAATPTSVPRRTSSPSGAALASQQSREATPSKDEVARLRERELRTDLLAALKLESGRVSSRWNGREALLLAASPYPDTPTLVADAQKAALNSLLAKSSTDLGAELSPQERAELTSWLRDRFEDEVYDILRQVTKDVEAYAQFEEACGDHPQQTYRHLRADAKRHADSLFYAGYLGDQSPQQAPHVARFLLADAQRVRRAASDSRTLERDRAHVLELRDVEDAFAAAEKRLAARPYSRAHQRELERARFLLEELRVSLFAQSLGTSARVSAPRLRRQLETLEQQ